MGRQKLKKSFQYEIKWRGQSSAFSVYNGVLIHLCRSRPSFQHVDTEGRAHCEGFHEARAAV